MRFISSISGLLFVLIFAGGMAVAKQTVPKRDIVIQADQYGYSCKVDRLVSSARDNTYQQDSRLNPERISLLNWNVYKGRRDNWTADFKRYIHSHDIVTIQEAHLNDDLKSMVDKEHHHWTINTAFHYKDNATGVMTAARVKPVRNCGQQTVEPLIRFPKTSLIGYYPVDGYDEPLLVANIHGINFTLGVDRYKQQMEKLYQAMKHHEGPVILAGDFNTWSDARMDVVDNLARRLSLSSLDYTNHNRTSVFGNALDHVFYRGLEPIEHDTWQVTSSDHNPTRVSFRVKNSFVPNIEFIAGEINENNC